MDRIAIRQARADDIQQLCLLNQEVQGIHVDLFPDVFKQTEREEIEDWFRETLNDDLIVMLVAESKRTVIGYLVLRKQIRPAHAFCKERGCGYIDQVCITEECRGRGIFGALMSEVEAIVRQWGLSRIELDVWSENIEARDAFARSGFTTYKEKMQMVLCDRAPNQAMNTD